MPRTIEPKSATLPGPVRAAPRAPQKPLPNLLSAVSLSDPSRKRSCAACVVRRLAAVVIVPICFATAARATCAVPLRASARSGA